MNHANSVFVVLLSVLCNVPAYAETMYRYLDNRGGVTYTNFAMPICRQKLKGVEVIDVPIPPDVASQQARKREEFDCNRIVAEYESVVACENEDRCKKTFSLAQIFVTKNSDTKIQIATDSIVETYDPWRPGTVGLKVSKIPGEGHSAKITLKVVCKAEILGIMLRDQYCLGRSIDLYEAFPQFLDRSSQ